jgi:prevent-host-death family protein
MEADIHQAKAHLSMLLEKVRLGEEVVITRAGRPIAKLIAISQTAHKRTIGSAKGDFIVPDDFNDPLPLEIEESFWK